MCVCVLVLIRSWISKFHRWNPLFYSISVFKMIRVASCNSDRVAWLCTASALVTAAEGTREQSDALLSNHAGELGEILIWLMTQLNVSAGVWLVSLQGLAITFLGPSCLCLSMEWCTEPPTGAALHSARPVVPGGALCHHPGHVHANLSPWWCTCMFPALELIWDEPASTVCGRQAPWFDHFLILDPLSQINLWVPPQNTRHRRKGTWFLEELIVQGVPTVF